MYLHKKRFFLQHLVQFFHGFMLQMQAIGIVIFAGYHIATNQKKCYRQSLITSARSLYHLPITKLFRFIESHAATLPSVESTTVNTPQPNAAMLLFSIRYPSVYLHPAPNPSHKYS